MGSGMGPFGTPKRAKTSVIPLKSGRTVGGGDLFGGSRGPSPGPQGASSGGVGIPVSPLSTWRWRVSSGRYGWCAPSAGTTPTITTYSMWCAHHTYGVWGRGEYHYHHHVHHVGSIPTCTVCVVWRGTDGVHPPQVRRGSPLRRVRMVCPTRRTCSIWGIGDPLSPEVRMVCTLRMYGVSSARYTIPYRVVQGTEGIPSAGYGWYVSSGVLLVLLLLS